MKKNFLKFTALALLVVSCGGLSDKEIELKERELALREKELGMSNSISSPEQQSNISPKIKTEAELKEELYMRECSRPSELLTGNLKMTPTYKNALSMKVDGLKIKCTIKNTATIATFKNIQARADFKSKTGSVVFSRTFSIYEFVGPRGSINYKTEFDITNQQYKDIDNYSWTILDAECK